MSRESPSCVLDVATRAPPRIVFPPLTLLYQWRVAPRFPRYDLSPSCAACECRWSRTCLRKAPCNISAAKTSATRSATAVTHNGASLVGTPISPVAAEPRGNTLSAVAAGATTHRTTVAVCSGRRRGRLLQSRRRIAAKIAVQQANPSLRKPSGPVPLPSRWN